jgi:hypothetical protein
MYCLTRNLALGTFIPPVNAATLSMLHPNPAPAGIERRHYLVQDIIEYCRFEIKVESQKKVLRMKT